MPALGVEDDGTADTRITSAGIQEVELSVPVETPLIEDVDISSKTFRYNPSMHAANRPVRVDLGSDQPRRANAEYFDERGAPVTYAGGWEKNLRELRLGRIIQDRTAMGAAAELTSRWGFRFLYNPTTISTSASRVDSFYIDPRSASNRVVSGINQNFQQISFQVLLDRVPDLMADNLRDDDYAPRLKAGDKSGLLKYGTHWDLEALFRVCNGVWDLKDMGKTGNIGVLFPANARLLLGKENYFGFIQGVNYTDVMFTQDMIPVRTRVDINFRRHVDIEATDVQAFLDRFPDALVSDPNASSDDEAGGGTTGGNPAGGSRPGDAIADTRGKGEYARMRTPSGQTVNARTYQLLAMIGKDLGQNILGSVTQGSYSTSVAASGGTHAGGGVVDLMNSSWSSGPGMIKILSTMRQWGLIAWWRTPAQGGWPYHIHAIDRGSTDMSSAAAVQVQNWKDGLNGLRGRTPDDGPRVPVPIYKYATS